MGRINFIFCFAKNLFLRSRKWILIFAVAAAVFFIVNGLAYHFTWLYKIPTTEDAVVRVNKYLEEGGMQDILADGQYDSTYLMAELNNSQPEILFSYFRPVAIVVAGKSGEILFSDVETAMLAGKYVLTSTALFSFMGDEKLAQAIKNGDAGVSIRLLADIRQDDAWKFETLELYYVGQNAVILQRQQPALFPDGDNFPFRLGRIEDLNPKGRESVIFGIGSIILNNGPTLRTYVGSVEFVDPDGRAIVVRASTVKSDFGGPIFAVRDGDLELLGLVAFGEGGEVLTSSIEDILDEIKGFGINLEFAK